MDQSVSPYIIGSGTFYAEQKLKPWEWIIEVQGAQDWDDYFLKVKIPFKDNPEGFDFTTAQIIDTSPASELDSRPPVDIFEKEGISPPPASRKKVMYLDETMLANGQTYLEFVQKIQSEYKNASIKAHKIGMYKLTGLFLLGCLAPIIYVYFIGKMAHWVREGFKNKTRKRALHQLGLLLCLLYLPTIFGFLIFSEVYIDTYLTALIFWIISTLLIYTLIRGIYWVYQGFKNKCISENP